MSNGSMGALAGPFRTLFGEGRGIDRTDSQHLERFLAGGEGAGPAFASLVQRHGPMVLRICRATLRDEHAAEDAFQATFLVLVRRAGSIRQGDSLASWLHGVALRTSASIRRRDELARRKEGKALALAFSTRSAHEGGIADPDLGRVLHEEVGRLPDRLRGPVILCYFEGLTHDSAADRLALPVGTVRSRLAAARDRLRDRLHRRGIAPLAGLEPATLPTVAPSLVAATVRLATGQGASASATILITLSEVSRVLFLTRLAVVGSLISALGLAVSAAAWVGSPGEPPRVAAISQPPRLVKAAAAKSDDPLLEALRLALKDAGTLTDLDARSAAEWSIGVALANLGAIDEARAALDLARAAAEATPFTPWQLHLRTQVALARNTAKDRAGAVGELVKIAEDVAKIDGTLGKVRAWGPIAEAQRRLGEIEAARATLRRARAAVSGLEDGDERLNALIVLIRSVATIGDFDTALSLIVAVPESQGNLKDPMLREVIKIAEKADRAEALRVLNRIAEIARTITYEVPRGTTQMSLAPALARVGDIAGGLRLARSIGRDNVQFDDRDSIPHALAAIAIIQGASGDQAGAKASLVEALAIARGLDQGAIRDERLRRIAEAQASLGLPDEASATTDLIRFPYEQAYAELAIAQARAKLGDRVGAARSFGEAIALAEARLPDHNRDWLLNQIVQAQAQTGQVVEAIATVKRNGDASWQAGALHEIAAIQARAGDIAGGTRTAESIQDPFYRPIVMKIIAAAKVQSGDLAQTLDWASHLEPAARAQALAGLAQETAQKRAAEIKAQAGVPGAK